jgi:hypothetical protein
MIKLAKPVATGPITSLINKSIEGNRVVCFYSFAG